MLIWQVPHEATVGAITSSPKCDVGKELPGLTANGLGGLGRSLPGVAPRLSTVKL